ncbi:MAG: homocysteine S-methyltransferase family protein [Rubripirellula sp.]
MITLLDGPLGTQLNARGVATNLPWWSAAAIDSAASEIETIHREYTAAGSTVHTANTFRTQQRTVGDQWERLARRAVQITLQTVDRSTHRVAGSIAPLEDCYRPDLSPGSSSRREHRELASVLADAGCDILLCETFAAPIEAIVAVEEAVRTGTETWIAFTAGPDGNLMTPQAIRQAAETAVQVGASAVLVNCTPAADTLRFVQAIAEAGLGVPIGAYANSGKADDLVGWQADNATSTGAYLSYAKSWIKAGATIVGGCCGTGPAHIAALADGLRTTAV